MATNHTLSRRRRRQRGPSLSAGFPCAAAARKRESAVAHCVARACGEWEGLGRRGPLPSPASHPGLPTCISPSACSLTLEHQSPLLASPRQTGPRALPARRPCCLRSHPPAPLPPVRGARCSRCAIRRRRPGVRLRPRRSEWKRKGQLAWWPCGGMPGLVPSAWQLRHRKTAAQQRHSTAHAAGGMAGCGLRRHSANRSYASGRAHRRPAARDRKGSQRGERACVRNGRRSRGWEGGGVDKNDQLLDNRG
jgi:hypothetical protein